MVLFEGILVAIAAIVIAVVAAARCFGGWR